jgi:hypothetical protein
MLHSIGVHHHFALGGSHKVRVLAADPTNDAAAPHRLRVTTNTLRRQRNVNSAIRIRSRSTELRIEIRSPRRIHRTRSSNNRVRTIVLDTGARTENALARRSQTIGAASSSIILPNRGALINSNIRSVTQELARRSEVMRPRLLNNIRQRRRQHIQTTRSAPSPIIITESAVTEHRRLSSINLC